MQEKFDGRRVLLMKVGPVITGVNRKGLTIGLPTSVMRDAKRMRSDFIIDGESVGDRLVAFDILAIDGENLEAVPYRARLVALLNLLAAHQCPNIPLAHTAFTAKEKQGLLQELRQRKKEGCVLKRLDAHYTAGRPNSGGNQLKHKFYETASVVVSQVNVQRSIEMRLLNQDGWQIVGKVTIPPNHRVPPVGTVVEVRYLYAFSESNCLYQPVYLGERNDIGFDACVLSQLKFKPANQEEE